jgi:hypothetical protein
MIPSAGYALREIEGITNEGGHEEQFHYRYEIVKEKSGDVVVSSETTALLDSLCMQKLGYPGRMISGSKMGYRNSRPDNLALFNSNLCTDEGKIWYGDIDVSKSKNDLQEIADKTGKNLFVLFESDGRFDCEKNPLLKKAAVVFRPGKKAELRKDLLQYSTDSWNS